MNTCQTSREYASGTLPEDPRLAQAQILQQIQQSSETCCVVRPSASVWKDVCKLLISTLAMGAFLLAVHFMFRMMPQWAYRLISVITMVAWCCVFGRRLLLTLILLYQKYAPEEMRASCLFEPCCSEYMKLAIQKYGVWRGVWKGIKRISRCRYPNGGIDNP